MAKQSNKPKLSFIKTLATNASAEFSHAKEAASCRGMVEALRTVEYAENAEFPSGHAAGVKRRRERGKLLKMCVSKGQGDLPITRTGDLEQRGEAIMQMAGLGGRSGQRKNAISPAKATKLLNASVEDFLSFEARKQPCRKTVGKMLDVSASMGRLYGVSGDTVGEAAITDMRSVRPTAAATMRRCVLERPVGDVEAYSRPIELEGRRKRKKVSRR